MEREKQIDEFQSMFKRASYEKFEYRPTTIENVCVITDGDAAVGENIQKELERFLPVLSHDIQWDIVTGNDFQDVNQLLKHLHDAPVDLIVVHRLLYEDIIVPQHSLGVYVDVLTQANEAPVLLLPGTSAQQATLDETCTSIMVATDHIAGDHLLINSAAHFAPQSGKVWFCHVEDDATFRHYIHAIERIPGLFTDETSSKLLEQLQSEAQRYIDNAIAVLEKEFLTTQWDSHIVQGHQVQTYRKLADEHEANLIVLNTKDQGQLAMHGLAYSISVEIMDRPLLLL